MITHASERHTERYPVASECQVVSERGFELLGRRAIDLSLEGMLVASDRLASIGDPVFVSLRVPGTRLWVDAEGHVARLVRGRRHADFGPALGVRFTRLDTTTRALLWGNLCDRPTGIPARPPRRDYAATVSRIAEG